MATSLPSPSNQFSNVPTAEIPRSTFNRSHGFKTTLDAGFLVPCYADEVIPGDIVNLKMNAFGRLATPISPFMDNLHLESFFFFIPNRILWPNFVRMMGEQPNPGDSTDFLVPQMTAPSGGHAIGSIADYLSIPPLVDGLVHSSLWHRAYNKTFNEWFRDENLQPRVKEDTGDGPDDPTDYVLLRRGKRHDYFTSALPWPQKGPAVPLPLTGDAPVTGLAVGSQTFGAGPAAVYETGKTSASNWSSGTAQAQPGNTWYVQGDPNNSGFPNIRADLSAVTAATINELRQAFQIQKLYERDARGGTRYTEVVRAHFGVVSDDARLQRPEYLGGGSSPIVVNPVAQTSETQSSGNTPQGNLAAIGTVQFSGHGFTREFTEHGILLGLISVRADLSYQQGLNRMFSRRSRFDFYWPALAHIGEQAVLNKEIYAQGAAADDDVFGYQQRWAEYRYKPSVISGKFRSKDPQTLNHWHLAQNFSGLPALNSSFIEDKPPVERVIAVNTEPHLLFDSYFTVRTTRRMPVNSVPGLIDHF